MEFGITFIVVVFVNLVEIQHRRNTCIRVTEDRRPLVARLCLENLAHYRLGLFHVLHLWEVFGIFADAADELRVELRLQRADGNKFTVRSFVGLAEQRNNNTVLFFFSTRIRNGASLRQYCSAEASQLL